MLTKIFSKVTVFIKKYYRGSFHNALTYGTASAATQILMMVYHLFIAYWIGATQYGYIAAAYAAASLSSFVFNWGLNEWMMRAGSTAKKPELLCGDVIFMKAILGIIWGLSLFPFLQIIRPELYLGNVLMLAILDVWLDSIFGTLLVIFLLTKRVKFGSFLLTMSRVARLILGVSIIALGIKSIVFILFIRMAGTFTMVLIAWFAAKPIINLSNPFKLWGLFRKSLSFNISELLNLIYLHADVNILSLLGTNPQIIGNYSIVINLIIAIIMLPLGIYNVMLPSLIRTYNEKKGVFAQKIKLLFGGYIIIGLIMWALLVIFSQPVIIILLGENFLTSAEFLISLAPLIALRTINQANIAYLITVGWQAKRILPQVFTLATKIATGSILVIKIGVQGMVLATIVTEILLVIANLVQVLRHNRQTKNPPS